MISCSSINAEVHSSAGPTTVLRIFGPRNSRRGRRDGATTVEFAVAAPLLFLFFFSALEFGRMNMIRHTMQNAAYEAARCGITMQADDDKIEDTAQAILRAASIRNADIRVDHGRKEITITISAPFRDQSWFAPLYFKSTTLASSMTLIKDLEDDDDDD
jgi:Flp pilus assembly protein TadG